jgi:excisionase family DNA binding protein
VTPAVQLPPEGPELEALIDALADRVAERLAARASPVPPALLSFREAAARLRVSRTNTLNPLIKAKKIRTVRVNGTVRIPVSELERIELEGASVIGRPPKPQRRPAHRRRPLDGRTLAAGIAALPDL